MTVHFNQDEYVAMVFSLKTYLNSEFNASSESLNDIYAKSALEKLSNNTKNLKFDEFRAILRAMDVTKSALSNPAAINDSETFGDVFTCLKTIHDLQIKINSLLPQ